MAKSPKKDETVCRNKKATHRFEILETVECGLALRGCEVKSLRDHNASIEEAYATIDDGELWLIGSHIAAYKFQEMATQEPHRRRKLLVHSAEIFKLKTRIEQKGQTLVPLRIYFNDRGFAKLTLGVVRGKKLGDKRDDLKARDDKREIERAMRGKR